MQNYYMNALYAASLQDRELKVLTNSSKTSQLNTSGYSSASYLSCSPASSSFASPAASVAMIKYLNYSKQPERFQMETESDSSDIDMSEDLEEEDEEILGQ